MTTSVLPARLPDGFSARLRADLRHYEAGNGAEVLVGGSPLRAVTLTPAARAMSKDGSLTVDGPAAAALARRLIDANLADPDPGSTPVRADLLTVVIPVRDRAGQLGRTLASLKGLSAVVVDDCSDDPAAIARVAEHHRARLVRLEVNRGPASARNVGLAKVVTPYVAFVDSDVAVDALTLRRLAMSMRDPAVALVGPLVRGVIRDDEPSWYQRYDALAGSLALGERSCSVSSGAAVGWLPSACLVGRAEALRGIGGFEEGLHVGEDVDLVWRLVSQGWRVRYEPSYEAYHDVRATLGSLLGRKYAYGTGGALLAARHGDAVAVARLSPLMAVAGAGLLVCRPWSVLGTAAALGWATFSVRSSLPEFAGKSREAFGLAVRGTGWAVRQESALILRHWWPVALVAAGVSPAARRALASALVVDAVVAATVDRPLQHPGIAPVGPAAAWLGRRLDDLSYGLGLWSGAWRARSLGALQIKVVKKAPRGGPSR
jgi:mycofactocin glycosyltransferase